MRPSNLSNTRSGFHRQSHNLQLPRNRTPLPPATHNPLTICIHHADIIIPPSALQPEGTLCTFAVEIASGIPRRRPSHNLSSHARKALTTSFEEHIGVWIWNRFTPHYTLKRDSWLNQAEIVIGLFSRHCFQQRRVPTVPDLKREAGTWNENMNRYRFLIDWRFTRAKARRKFHYRKNRFTRSKD